ncbi:hypothetical protein BDV39DRAFT_175544 [Aspergillus sergii]|uniref:Uncharacterized protein n=1 Tax=Aspergillus sergii TaxID=1034303 RepID=A0A5N6X753_9EURO|nr:hypothetical protein BDV39DRAFT_175544 [Aspergillus sergii]
MCAWFGKGTSSPNVTLLCYNTAFVVFLFCSLASYILYIPVRKGNLRSTWLGTRWTRGHVLLDFLFNGGMTQRVCTL